MEYAVYRMHGDGDVWVNQFSTYGEATTAARNYHDETNYEYAVVAAYEIDIPEDGPVFLDECDVRWSTDDDLWEEE